MEKEFIPYEQALALKELGFDEKCISVYLTSTKKFYPIYRPYTNNEQTDEILRPLYQQAFSWFREKYGLYHSIGLDNSLENDVNCDYQIINHSQTISELKTDFKSYEEAELECLKKLIEIVKSK
jgi:hypothetical protein